MPPAQKRKRGDRNYSQDNVERGRPSPHRPENLSLAQQNGAMGGGRGGGGRRASRGGRGGSHQHHQPPSSPAPVSTNRSATASAPSTPSAQSAGRPAASTQTNMDPPPPVNPPPSRIATPAAIQRSVPEVPTLQHPTAGSPPKEDPSSYSSVYFTPERINAWQESGRQTILAEVVAKAESEDDQELGVYFQDVLHLVTEGLIHPQDAGVLIKEMLETASTTEKLDLPSLFVDTVAVMLSPQYVTGKENTGKEFAIKQFLEATGVDPKLVCTLLDERLLMALRIVKSTFVTLGIRHSTNVLYRQSGFNLLREESEGYSKLMTEYFTVTHNFRPDRDTVEKTWERVKALIGAFDLDVGRVLDITLDAFANNLIKHNKFFIRLLRFSDFWPRSKSLDGFTSEEHGFSTLPPWAETSYGALETLPDDAERIAGLRHGRDLLFWDRARQIGVQAFFELGGRRAIPKEEMAAFLEELRNSEDEAASDGKEAEKRDETLDQWTARTNTFPPQGNSIAAQILGFKLRFYASDARGPKDELPDNLIWLAALLIKLGFISLKDLYPHLYPADDKMDEVRATLEKEKEERIKKLKGGDDKNNALLMAGALSTGEPELSSYSRTLQDSKTGSRTPLRNEATASTAATATPPQNEPAKPALIPPADQKILLLKSLLLIGAIPDALFMLGRFPWLLDLHDDLPRYIFRLLHRMLRKVSAEAQTVRSRPSDLATGKMPIDVNNNSVLATRPPPRSIAWGRLEKTEWSEGEFGTSYRYYWDEWSDLVPVCQNIDDVFTMCDSFLNIVGHKIGRDSELLTKLIRVGAKSLKDDDSAENVARWKKLAKRLLIPALSLTKQDPGTVNEAWELIKLFPVSVRFNIYAEWFTGQTSRQPDIKEAFDIARSKTKDVLKRISKTNIKEQARELAKVAYASPGIALATAWTQIEAYNNLIDVIIECVRYFTNIGFDVLVWSLLNALGVQGRDHMQGDGMLVSKWLQRLSEFTGKVCRRYYKDLNIRPILQYIKNRLENEDSVSLVVLAQVIQSMGGIRSDQNWSEEQIIALSGRQTLRAQILKRVEDKRHESRSTSLRLVDSLTSTGLTGPILILIALERQKYLERETSSGIPIKVLSTTLTALQFAFVQYLDFLRSNFSIEDFDDVVPQVEDLIQKFGIEPAIAFTIARPSIQFQIDQTSKNQEAAKTQTLTNGDEMGDVTTAKELPAPAVNGSTEESKPASSDDASMVDKSQPSTPAASGPLTTSVANPVLQLVAERLRGVMPPEFEESMSMTFYVRFWQTSLSDIVVSGYDEEIKNVRVAIRDLGSERGLSTEKAKQHDKDKKALQQVDKDLAAEWRDAIKHMTTTKKALTEERTSWFADFPPDKHNVLTDAIIQECLLPRIRLSETDALFTAKFVFLVHKMSTPSFRTLGVLVRMVKKERFIAILFMLTEREARNMGLFLKEVLGQLRVWQENKSLYEKEGLGPRRDNPGFALKVRDDNTVDTGDTEAVLSHDEYRRRLFAIHSQLHLALLHCLQSKEFMHIRNAILLLKQVHQVFPIITYQGTQIQKDVQRLSNEEIREDLKLSALSLLGDLKKMKEKWVLPQAFRPGEGTLLGKSETPTTQPGTPSGSKLDAGAPESRPKLLSSSSIKGAEDGEIEDEKEGEKEIASAAASAETTSQSQSEAKTEQSTPAPAPVTAAATSQRQRPGETPRAATPAGIPARPLPASGRNDGRPSTPSGPSSNVESIRTSTPSGHPRGLPARPDGPIPPHPRDARAAADFERTSRPDPRGLDHTSRHERPLDPVRSHDHHSRLERPNDPARDSLRRRSMSPGRGSRNRSPEGRQMRPEFEHRESGYGRLPPRDAIDPRDPRAPRLPHDPRDERHRSDRDYRRGEVDPRLPPPFYDSRTAEREPSRADAPPRDAGPAIDPGRAAQLGLLNAERAALIEQQDRRAGLDRTAEDERRHGRRRGQSPPRDDARSQPGSSRGPSPRRSERVGPERPPPRSGPRDRRDEASNMPPAGPADGARGRNELFPGSNSRNTTDPSHGRLAQIDQRSQDSEYGRLKAPLQPEVPPSGPKGGRNQGRNSRAVAEPAPTPTGPRHMPASSPATNMPPASPVSERPPPSGPLGSSRRGPPATPVNPASNTSAAPLPTPTTDSPAAGIHPSRLQQIEPLQTKFNSTAPPSSGAGSMPPSGPRSGGGSGPTSGPQRSASGQVTTQLPSPTSRYPPTGPAGSGGSLRGQRSQISLINGMLGNQPGPRDNGPPTRGRMGSGQGNSAPQSPISGPGPQPSFPGPQGSRSDSLADRIDRPGAAGGEEMHRGGSRRGGDGSPRDDGRRSSGRHGRERSRSPRREAADNAMRQSGDLTASLGGFPGGPTSGPREEGGRRGYRDGAGEREGGQRDRRSRGGGSAENHSGRERERDNPRRDSRDHQQRDNRGPGGRPDDRQMGPGPGMMPPQQPPHFQQQQQAGGYGSFGGGGPPPMPGQMPHGGPNGDMRRGGGGRQDDGHRRESGGKRRRPEEGGPSGGPGGAGQGMYGGHDHKRPRRGQQ